MPEMPTSPSQPLRLILAGVGFWGNSWIPVIATAPDWRLAGLVDADEAALERAATVARLPRSACFESISAATQAIEADAVLIVVPPALHAPLALEALEKGMHCLIEKPFAETIVDARAVVAEADAAGRVVMVSQQYRHRPGARTVARLLETEALGPLGSAYVRFAHELAGPGFQYQMEEPLLRDVAIHHFDLVRGILRVEPTRVQAMSSNPSWSPLRGNASATVALESSDGVMVSYAGTLAPRGSRTAWDGVWEIHCSEGTIRWHADEVVVRPLERPLLAKIRARALKRDWKGRRVKPASIPQPDRLGSLAELADAIRHDRVPSTSARDNIRSLALTLAAVESAQRRSTVDVSEVLSDRHAER